MNDQDVKAIQGLPAEALAAVSDMQKRQDPLAVPWTPGPWEVSPVNDGLVRAISGYTVTEIRETSTARRNNARLIAAAPAMAAALAEIARTCHADEIGAYTLRMVTDLLHKIGYPGYKD